MAAILFGSISTVADTSELQRDAFNRAFEAHGLDWHWSREDYVEMLGTSGGEKRISEYAAALGQSVDAGAVHRSKSKLFREGLADSQVTPRPGVVTTIQGARSRGLKVGFVTTTAPENIDALIAALEPAVRRADFDVVVSLSDVEAPKPDKAAYALALTNLDEQADGCIAIEDNIEGLASALAAGLQCVAFSNQNTAGQDFGDAPQVDHLDLDQLQGLLPAE